MKKIICLALVLFVGILPTQANDFSIVGEVRSPGNYSFEEDHNIYDGIAMAGGLTGVAARKKIRINRRTSIEGKRNVFYINFRKDLIVSIEGDLVSYDPKLYTLQDGDIIYVKPSRVRQFAHFMMSIIKSFSGAAVAGAVAGSVS